MDEIINTEDYSVHFKQLSENRVEWIVYPTIENGKFYKNSDNGEYYEFNPNLSEVAMRGSMCWKGLWEDRYYMVQEEYWYGELKELSDLYSNHIEEACKEQIRLTCKFAE